MSHRESKSHSLFLPQGTQTHTNGVHQPWVAVLCNIKTHLLSIYHGPGPRLSHIYTQNRLRWICPAPGETAWGQPGPARLIGLHKVRSAHPSNQLEPPNPSLGGASGHGHTAGRSAAVGELWRGRPGLLLRTLPGRGWGSCAMCTTLFLLSTLAMLWRRRSANRVHP